MMMISGRRSSSRVDGQSRWRLPGTLLEMLRSHNQGLNHMSLLFL